MCPLLQYEGHVAFCGSSFSMASPDALCTHLPALAFATSQGHPQHGCTHLVLNTAGHGPAWSGRPRERGRLPGGVRNPPPPSSEGTHSLAQSFGSSWCEFSGAAKAKCHSLGGLTNRNLLLPVLEARIWDGGITGLVPEASLLGVDNHLLPVSPCSHPSVRAWVLISSYNDARHIGFEPTPRTSLYLNHLLKGSVPAPVTF